MRFKEYKNGVDLFAITIETGAWAYGVADALSDIIAAPDPTIGIVKLVLANIFPSMVLKGYESYTALPPIKQAIIKMDK